LTYKRNLRDFLASPLKDGKGGKYDVVLDFIEWFYIILPFDESETGFF